MKTSVANSRRSDSADGSRAPFSRASFASPCRSVTDASTGECARSPAIVTRPADSPNWISCASWRVRGEKPCVATCSDSSRFVLPTPFRPDGEHEAGLEGELERGVRAVVTKREPADDQPARRIGMIRYT